MIYSMLARGAVVTLLVATAACRAQPRTWPSDDADLTGQILDARPVRGLDGLTVTLSPAPWHG